jgi:hypothetical protein
MLKAPVTFFCDVSQAPRDMGFRLGLCCSEMRESQISSGSRSYITSVVWPQKNEPLRGGDAESHLTGWEPPGVPALCCEDLREQQQGATAQPLNPAGWHMVLHGCDCT